MAKKQKNSVRALEIVGGVALLIVAWRFPLPLTGFAQPTTLLSAIAVLLGIALGPVKGALIALVYVFAAIVDLPPMIWGQHPGIEPFFSLPLSGFNLGLIVAALVAGKLAPQKTHSGPAHLALAAILGHLAYLVVGIAWLTQFSPLARAAPAVIHSQIIAVLVKSALAFAAAYGLGRVTKR